jgi:WD40 repeat protein
MERGTIMSALHTGNPYIGPRTFTTEEGDLYFGREREARDLLSVVITERLVLFYAQSGAGKSSLINTRLIPGLIEQGEYRILPVGRLLGEAVKREDVENIYIYNLVSSLIKRRVDGSRLAKLTLSGFLAGLDHDEQEGYFYNEHPTLEPSEEEVSWKYVLVIDQFEQLFTAYPEEWKKREDFFRQLAQALEDYPNLRFVLTMRDDYVALLEPYIHLLPGRLRCRYYMERFGQPGALEAVQGPAIKMGRPFVPEVAHKLVSDLSTVQVHQPDDTLQPQPGQWVEPVQLQVVCYSLWEQLPPDCSEITQEHLNQFVGDVDQALGNYYAARVEAVAAQMKQQGRVVSEHDIREWFGTKLITRDGIRNMVAQEKGGRSGGLDDAAVQEFVRRGDLVRAEKRGGATFYELTHDRLVDPVRQNNGEWFETKADLLQRRVGVWLAQGRSSGLLLRGRDLRHARKLARSRSLTDDERSFLETSVRTDRNRALLLAATALVLVIMMSLTVFAMQKSNEATNAYKASVIQYSLLQTSEAQAFQLKKVAEGNAATANANQQEAKKQKKLAWNGELSAQSVAMRDRNFQLSLLLGIEAYKSLVTIQSWGALMDNVQAHSQLLAYLSGHSSGIASVAFSPDGKTLASGSYEGTVILWDLATGKLIGQLLSGHTNVVSSVAFSPDGKTLASGSYDGTVILWNVATRQPIGQPLRWHGSIVTSVAFSPDGNTLASGSDNGTVILWDVATRQPIGQPLSGHTSVTSVAFSPDGKTLASGSADQTVILWDVVTRQPIGQPLSRHTNVVTSVAFSPDGNTLASGSWDQTVILWDVATRQPIGQPLSGHGGIVTSVAFSPDSKTLASGSWDQTVILWDVATRQPIGQPLSGHTNIVTSVAFNPNGKTLASGSYDGSVILWDMDTGKLIGQPLSGHTNIVTSVAFSPDGKILASGSADSTVILWDVTTRQPIGQPLKRHTEIVTSMAFSPDGKTLASGSDDGSVILWDVATRQPIGQPLKRHSERVTSMAFNPDGKTLASGSDDGTVILWDVTTRKPTGQPLKRHSERVTSVAFSPAGKILASGSDNGTVILWDVTTGKPTGQPLSGHTNVVTSMAFSPDGNTLASGSADQTVILWDVETRQPTGQPLSGHTNIVTSVAFSPYGKALASGSDDQTVILWDVATRQPIGQPLKRHSERVTSVAFNPDGKTLASGSADNTVILWNLDPQSWIEKSCQRAGRNLNRVEWAQYLPGQDYPAQQKDATCPQWQLDPAATDILTPTP